MKLLDLHPAWFALPGRERMGVVFDCPCCAGTKEPTRLGIPFSVPKDGGVPFVMAEKLSTQCALWGALGGQANDGDTDPVRFYPPPNTVVGGVLWAHSGEDFASLSLMPSVHAGAAGHWHGFITNGEVRTC